VRGSCDDGEEHAAVGVGGGIIFGGCPGCELLVGGGIVGAGLDLEDGGVLIDGQEGVPDIGLEIGEAAGVAGVQECAILHGTLVIEEEEGDGSVDDDDGFDRVGLWVAVGPDIGARLHEIDEALDLALIGAMDGLHHASARTGAGGREPRGEQRRVAEEDIARWFWAGQRERG